MSTPPSRRFHHVAFATRDAAATYEFYAEKLGMPLVHCENHLQGDGWFRHFFFDVGQGECLGFFEFSGIGEEDGWRSDVSTGVGLPSWVNHVAFDVPATEDLDAMVDRCRRNGVRLGKRVDHGWCESVYIRDPNGILVEFCVTTEPEAFGQSADEALRRLSLRPEEFAEAERKEIDDVATRL